MVKFSTLWHKHLQNSCSTGITALVLWSISPWARAQVISSQDAVQTQVIQRDNQFEILGGTTTDADTLLFHSFEQFDLESGQTAKFLVAPDVEAVFSRITNNVPSYINGLVELGGSAADLYLINPAGIVFGAESSINLAGDFTVLTAERLDFSQGSFDLSGYPDNIQGNILRLQFDPNISGTIVNLGALRVGVDQSLSLIGHSVVNQGSLSGGAIDIVAVGTHETVVLTGRLQFAPTSTPIPHRLPPWLTSTGVEHATTFEFDSDGTLRLTGSQLSDLPSGTALVSGQIATSQELDQIQILGDHVATLGAIIETANGGRVLIGGDYQGRGSLPTAQSTLIDTTTLITANGEAGGQVVIWSDGITQFEGTIRAQGEDSGGFVEVSGKEQLHFDGQVDLRSHGTLGTLLLGSENIEIRTDSEIESDDPNSSQILRESTLESSIIDNVNVSLRADDDITIGPLSDGALTFGQGTGRIHFLADSDGDGDGSFTMAPGDSLDMPGWDLSITAADIIVGAVDTSIFSSIDNDRNAGDIRLTATGNSIVTGDLNSTARSILNNSGNGGDLSLSAIGSINTGNIFTTASAISNSGNSGDIALNTQAGTVSTGFIETSVFGSDNSGAGGDVSLNAFLSIDTADIDTSAQAYINNARDGGDISLISLTGDIATTSLTTNTSASGRNTGDGGSIVLTVPQGSITTHHITSTTVSPDFDETQGGDVRLTANGAIMVDSINTTGEGQGGNIDITTQQLLRIVDTIPDTETSVLTSDNGTVRLIYSSDPTQSFSLGNSDTHGTAGSITTGSDSLMAPQSVTQIRLDTIEINNAFASSQPPIPDLPADVSTPSTLPFSNHPEATPGSSTEPTPQLPISSILPSSDSPDLSELETVNIVNNDEKTTKRATDEQTEAISDSALLWAEIDAAFSAEFAQALKLPVPTAPSLQMAQQALKQASEAQNITPALMYVRLKNTHVELVLTHSEGPPIYRPIAVTAAEVHAVAKTFHQTVTNPMLRPAQYLPAAQQLYDWLVRPMLDDLELANIDHIGFVLDSGLRTLPMAALHDGQHFLIENYSVGLLPSLGLTDLEPSPKLLSESEGLKPDTPLAIGVANFETHADLAAVPLELELASQSTRDKYYLDHEATLDVLQRRLEHGNYTSLHLATHAVFQPDSLDDSYIQLWDQAVRLNQLQELPLDAIDFLILSACTTALGNSHAEFGFAGLAVNVGVQTVLASLWSISDEGTLGLMSEFYQTPGQPRSKALQQAQLAMLQGQVGIANGTVYGSGDRTVGHLPDLDRSGSWDFSHPAYWSGFVMIGNSW